MLFLNIANDYVFVTHLDFLVIETRKEHETEKEKFLVLEGKGYMTQNWSNPNGHFETLESLSKTAEDFNYSLPYDKEIYDTIKELFTRAVSLPSDVIIAMLISPTEDTGVSALASAKDKGLNIFHVLQEAKDFILQEANKCKEEGRTNLPVITKKAIMGNVVPDNVVPLFATNENKTIH